MGLEFYSYIRIGYIYIQVLLGIFIILLRHTFPALFVSQRNILASSSSVVTQRPPFARVVVIVITLS